MKILLEIANGYKRGELQKWFDESAGSKIDPDKRREAIEAWIEQRYGTWIRDHGHDTDTKELGGHTDYTIAEITDADFVIDFTYEDDAETFRKRIGGRVVEE